MRCLGARASGRARRGVTHLADLQSPEMGVESSSSSERHCSEMVLVGALEAHSRWQLSLT